MNTMDLQVIIREPGNGSRYVVLVVDLTDLPEDQRRALGVGAEGRAYQATLVNFPGRPTIIFTGRVADSYLKEKCPSLGAKDACTFAGICREIFG